MSALERIIAAWAEWAAATVVDPGLSTSVSEPATLASIGLGAGVLLAVLGVSNAFLGQSVVQRRMRALAPGRGVGSAQAIEKRAFAPSGFVKSFVPMSPGECSRIGKRLARAGYRRPDAVRNYFVLRTLLGVVLPVLVWGVIHLASDAHWIPDVLRQMVTGLTRFQVALVLAAMVASGFYAPALWLRSRVQARQARIEESFPSALDLLQVAVEAGLGFDAALTRIANEMLPVAPDIAEEFIAATLEVQAGRDRRTALLDMADRMGVEEARQFVQVILQSVEYGTSMSAALRTYAQDMRTRRELRAEEKANKLPVQLSVVMSVLLLPALLLITLGPTIIRYIRFFV